MTTPSLLLPLPERGGGNRWYPLNSSPFLWEGEELGGGGIFF